MAQATPILTAPLLHAFCHRCGRWRVLEHDGRATGHEAQCADCGELGLVRARTGVTKRELPWFAPDAGAAEQQWRILL